MSFAPEIPSFPLLESTSHGQLWERFCALLWHDEALGFWLDASRMALSPDVLTSLQSRFDSAFAAMAALEKGSVANPDEQRQVGHYWLRTPQLAPDPAITEELQQQYQAMAGFAHGVLEGSITTATGQAFTDVVWIGIGGSGLGPLLIVHALQQTGVGLRFHFIDNVDPEGMGRTYGELGERLKTSLVIVVSKSGSTPEPHIGMVQTRRCLEQLGGQWPAQAVPLLSREASWIGKPVRKVGCNVLPCMTGWVGAPASPLLLDCYPGCWRVYRWKTSLPGRRPWIAPPVNLCSAATLPRSWRPVGSWPVRGGERGTWWFCPIGIAWRCSAATCSSW